MKNGIWSHCSMPVDTENQFAIKIKKSPCYSNFTKIIRQKQSAENAPILVNGKLKFQYKKSSYQKVIEGLPPVQKYMIYCNRGTKCTCEREGLSHQFFQRYIFLYHHLNLLRLLIIIFSGYSINCLRNHNCEPNENIHYQ